MLGLLRTTDELLVLFQRARQYSYALVYALRQRPYISGVGSQHFRKGLRVWGLEPGD